MSITILKNVCLTHHHKLKITAYYTTLKTDKPTLATFINLVKICTI